MQSVNNQLPDARQQIARLAALTLIFSYAELLVPRVIPFFRLGLGNAALLMGLGLSFPAFILLTIIKTVAANLMAGTLFSPFFLVSFAQSVASALVMYVMGRAVRQPRERSDVHRGLLSLYGISVAGSAVSAAVQISLSSLYLGQGTWSLLGPMLLFNAVSGVITAWLAESLGGGSIPLARTSLLATPSNGGTAPRNAPRNILWLMLLITASAAVFFIKNVYILGASLCVAFLAQKLSHRKILLLPYLSLWLFVLVTSVLIPSGRVLYSFAGFSITAGALLTGLQKALRLSIVSALSQCAVTIQPKENTLLALTLNYYKLMLDSFVNTQGSIITKLKAALR